MSKKKRKNYSREFKIEAVKLIIEKVYSIAEASRNLGIDYSVCDDGKTSSQTIHKTHSPVKECSKLRMKSSENSSVSLNA